MQDRFKRLLEEKDLTATRFAALIKVNASAMSHILNGRSKPGFDVLDKIAQAFPDVNLNWLISGKGSLYNNTTTNKVPKCEPLQPSLFPEETKTESKPIAYPISESQDNSLTAEVSHISPNGKKIKRIILFFEDGSFEHYEK